MFSNFSKKKSETSSFPTAEEMKEKSKSSLPLISREKLKELILNSGMKRQVSICDVGISDEQRKELEELGYTVNFYYGRINGRPYLEIFW